MAYAALLSLTQTAGELILNQDKYPISHSKKQQIRSIYEPFILLQEFLQDFTEKGNNLDGRIRDAAYEAIRIIECLMLEEVSSHWWTVLAVNYKFKHLRAETDSITREVMILKNNSPKIKDAASTSCAAAVSPSRQAHIINIDDKVVGLHEDLVAIKSRLCGESSSLQVIPIVGMGGIGKTTLAKYAYDDLLTKQHFDIRAWVTVTQDYSAGVILSCLLACVEMFYKERSERSSEEVLVGEKVFRILKRRRYLIVLDDIWNTEVWDDIRNILPDDDNGSRIMLTARLTDVAAYPDPCSPLHVMRLMDECQSWDLLRQKVFDRKDCPPELENIGKEIARSCKGLPLAVVVVAGLLSAVSEDPTFWREIADNVNSVAIEGGQIENILLLSYAHLPHYLRPCFLYMGMFPEDCEVRVSTLIKLWAAEGFLRLENGSRRFEHAAEDCLKNLVKRSLVLVTKRKSDGRTKSCSLHDLMRDLCIRKAYEEKFIVNFGSRYVKDFLSVKSRENNHRRVSVTPSSLPYLSTIYSLTIRAIFCSGRVPLVNMLKSFRLLRVLDAGEAYLTSIPYELFELFYLVYLSVYYLGRIPAVVSKLQNLQTLVLHSRNEWRLFRAQAICLPHEIWLMPQLRHLVFYGRLPNPQGRTPSILGNLQTLSIVSEDVCTERILRMIPNLKKMEIHCSDCPQGETFMNHLVHLHQLENLKLRSYFSYEIWHKDNFILPRTLKKLSLSRVALPWDEMTIVGSLPNLQVLKLTHHCCKGNKTWETSEGEFAELEFLLIEKSDLQHWITDSSSHFPMLKCVVLDDCWQLAEIPEGVGEASTLELIEVKGRARKSLVESANRILEEQRDWGNEDIQVRCMTRR